VFREKGRFACALRALDRRDYSSADAALTELLLDDRLTVQERGFLLNKRGVARIGLEHREPARADFTAALEVLPGYAPALTNLGNLLLEQGDVGEAIERYERAIRSDVEYALAYFNLSVAYKKSGRLAESVGALRQAQRLEQRANAASFWQRVRRR
jgi:tetratricopeptide (TPR) repeat protein